MKTICKNILSHKKMIIRITMCAILIMVSSYTTKTILKLTYDKKNTTEERITNNEMIIVQNTIEETFLGINEYIQEEIPLPNYTEEKIETNESEENVKKINYVFTNAQNILAQRGVSTTPVLLLKNMDQRMEIDDETYEVLLRVVEAEVTGSSYTYKGQRVSEEEMLLSKIRVAQVFMNRVENTKKFSKITNLYDALTQKGASSTFEDGRYYSVTVCDLTREAVDIALLENTPDYTDGALFFNSCSTYVPYGEYLFTDNVGHNFFK